MTEGSGHLIHLLISAKYAENDAARAEEGRKFISACIEAGAYDYLLKASGDAELPAAMRRASESSILRAAVVRAKAEGADRPIRDLATRGDSPPEISHHAGMMLVESAKEAPDGGAVLRELATTQACHSKVRTASATAVLDSLISVLDEAGIESLARDQKFPISSRESAALFLSEYRDLQGDNLALLLMATGTEIPVEGRIDAGIRAIRRAAKNDDYDFLLKMEDYLLPMGVEEELAGKAQAAAREAIRKTDSRSALEAISREERLPEEVRELARSKAKTVPETDDNQKRMTAELLLKMAMHAGMSSERPGRASEPPPSRRSPIPHRPVVRIEPPKPVGGEHGLPLRKKS
ncbi:MAG: hypothetical protein AB1324_00945 [Candidatus Micrarchaeota archaeon]